MAVKNISGTDGLFKVNGLVFGCATDLEISYETETQEATCRGSNGFKEFAYGIGSWSGSASNAVHRVFTGDDVAANIGLKTFKDFWRNKTIVDLEWGSKLAGGEIETGKILITNVTDGSPLNGQATFSVSFQGTGKPSVVTNQVDLPDAPTDPVTNDVANTFDFTFSSYSSTLSAYEQTLDGGATYTTLTAKPIAVGAVAKAAGQVGVRVKETANNAASATLYNKVAFTV